jgi:hypothetical protein
MMDSLSILERDNQDFVEDVQQSIYGTRMVNSTIVELLWYSALLAHRDDDNKFKKIATGRMYRYDGFGHVGMILHQLKYWQDIKTRDNKFKFDFHKSVSELEQEFPWIGSKSIGKYLRLLADIEVIKREQGKFRYNNQKYTYELNYEHPVVLALYAYEAFGRYIAHRKEKEGEHPLSAISNPDYAQVYEFITNKSVRKKLPNGVEETTEQYGNYFHTVWKFLLDSTNTSLMLLYYYAENKSASALFEEIGMVLYKGKAEEKKGEVGIPSKDTSFNYFAHGRLEETTKRNEESNVTQLEEAALEKLANMTPQQVQDIKKLYVGKWRKEKRKGYYQKEMFDAAKQWLQTLDQDSLNTVVEFQEEMYNGNGKISKESSYSISTVDAFDLADNFLQFVANKHKAKPAPKKERQMPDEAEDMPETPNYNKMPIAI